jgi:hypothetical protein
MMLSMPRRAVRPHEVRSMSDSGHAWVSTGRPALDAVLDGLRVGDNVVWIADAIEEYSRFVQPFVQRAVADGRRVIYFRYGRHDPLINVEPDHAGVCVHELDAHRGFEAFTSRIHQIITHEGRGAFYVFDCLSDLLAAWATDRMIGDFFRVTCPYLFELDTVAYFGLLRARHSFKTIGHIRQTTQVLLGLHTHRGRRLVQPIKVWQRQSPTMFLPHVCDDETDERFVPVADSNEATLLSVELRRSAAVDARRHLDHWDRLFIDAELLLRQPADDPQVAISRRAMVEQLCRVMMGRDERILALARMYFGLDDLMAIKARLIGTGYIGGKTVGMLLARQILRADRNGAWDEVLEPHDSFYIGSDVYYGYLVHNGLWRLLMRQKTEGGYFDAADELQTRMLRGSFPDEIRLDLLQMLEYFGQYPIIIRSSSLLEDGFGNAFAGKYASFFRVNRGTPEQRCAQVEDAIRQIFASGMSPDALAYRQQRGLQHLEEPMALLIQRVSGSHRGHYYFPDAAGVGVSCNPFVWSRDMDPRAGMLRLVLGLGTRAVDRVEGDYPCIVALDHPRRKPHKDHEDARRFSQHDVDLLDINANTLRTLPLRHLVDEGIHLPLEHVAVREPTHGQQNPDHADWVVTFDPLLADDRFTQRMQRMLKTLEHVYDHPVDVEFTINFGPDGLSRINLVQCRPLQTRGSHEPVPVPWDLDPARVLFQCEGGFMGGSVVQPIARIILVEPRQYAALPLAGKYEVARVIGRLNRALADQTDGPVMLIGPGRWGTSTPSLGVPVRFSEINHMQVLVETADAAAGMMPDLSFGTHFFQDLVENATFYVALFPGRDGCVDHLDWLRSQPAKASPILADAPPQVAQAVRVYDVAEHNVRLIADVVSQRLVCCHD